ncbi:hypothetical protein [Ruania halotolerans]|uniref:golvesin C-terminal-like domain-containing protein n=1 Tax=Ruania halotolerans TaxID=2897773 RepID=UPI001E5CD2C5|nr:hypothetical protein [Ruania halotolerans]UFU06135.1 hypothetical protein LQF10_17170 [Ruania halotolerans]
MENSATPAGFDRRRFLKYSAAAASTVVVASSTPTALASADAAPSGPIDIIVDNPDAELLPASDWSTSRYANGYYGGNYAVSNWSETTTAVARWRPDLPSPGDYSVQIWLPDGDPNRSGAAAYKVHHSGQVTTVHLNQQEAGGFWRAVSDPLPFTADGSEYIELVVSEAQTPLKHVNADAARFVEPYVPAVPQEVTAVWIPGGEAEVGWAVADDVDHYVVRRSDSIDGPFETVAARVVSGSFLDVDTEGESDFAYTVAAVGPGGESDPSEPFLLERPDPPRDAPEVTIEPGNQQIGLTWDDVDSADRYVVRREVDDGSWVVVANRIVRLTYTVGRLPHGIDAKLTVSAANAGGEGPQTEVLEARPSGPPLHTPQGLVAAARDGAVELRWHGTDDAESYLVERAIPRGRRTATFEMVAETTEPIYVDEDVAAGFVHHYRVRGKNDDGPAVRSSFQASAVPGTSIEFVMRHSDAELDGEWGASSVMPGYRGHEAMVTPAGSGGAATYTPPAQLTGQYSVWMWFPHGDEDAASNAPVTVVHAGGEDTFAIDQRGAGCHWARLGDGVFTFDATAGHHVRVSSSSEGYVVADAIRLLPAAETASTTYQVDWTDPQQLIEGMGVEVLYDCLQPGGQLQCTTERVPQSLADAERDRWYDEMLTGFRHIRLALGLYLRGTDEEGRLIQGVYPGQIDDIAESAQRSGATVTPTYWSPAPYFKSTDHLLGGQLTSYDSSLLGDIADAMSADIDTLKAHGVPVGSWSLQNEPQNRPPNQSTGPYSMCYYAPPDYVTTFNTVAARIRSDHPELHIFGPDSGAGTTWITELTADDQASALMEGWSWHNGHRSDDPDSLVEAGATWKNLRDKPLVNTEFSYSGSSAANFVSTAKNILYHFLYYGSPTWYWLHALQPTNSNFADTRALGVWRPDTDSDPDDRYAHLNVGHWEFVGINWHPIVGFVKLMPHDAVRYSVLGDSPKDRDVTLFAFEGPDGSRGVAVLNGGSARTELSIDLGDTHHMTGAGFSEHDRFTDLGTQVASRLDCVLEPETMQFWTDRRVLRRRRALR